MVAFWVGDHWAVLAGGFLTIAHQTALLGLAATLYGAREGYRVVTPFLRTVYWATRLEHMLVAGCRAGARRRGGAWLRGPRLARRRLRRPADDPRDGRRPRRSSSSALQTMFGGFLLSVIGGNEVDVLESIADRFDHDRADAPAGDSK